METGVRGGIGQDEAGRDGWEQERGTYTKLKHNLQTPPLTNRTWSTTRASNPRRPYNPAHTLLPSGRSQCRSSHLTPVPHPQHPFPPPPHTCMTATADSIAHRAPPTLFTPHKCPAPFAPFHTNAVQHT
eukprot:365284-Chlamydomonas_euryale.AAC.4